MEILTLMNYALAIAVLISLCMTVFYFVTGIKTKDYESVKKPLAAYLILNIARLLLENFILK